MWNSPGSCSSTALTRLGWAPLHRASDRGDVVLAWLLLEHGAEARLLLFPTISHVPSPNKPNECQVPTRRHLETRLKTSRSVRAVGPIQHPLSSSGPPLLLLRT